MWQHVADFATSPEIRTLLIALCMAFLVHLTRVVNAAGQMIVAMIQERTAKMEARLRRLEKAVNGGTAPAEMPVNAPKSPGDGRED